MTIVWWARHGENVANVSRTFSHRTFDGDLTDRGRAQAHLLADHLATAGPAFAAVWCSPLRRARQTADILTSRLDLPVAGDDEGLRELNVGELDGRNDAGAWATYDTVLAAWRAGDLGVRFPSGENAHELVTRLLAALRHAANPANLATPANPADTAEAADAGAIPGTAPTAAVLVVAHGGNLRAALPMLTGAPDPGHDMPPATAARLAVHPETPESLGNVQRGHAVRLLSWPDPWPHP